MQIVLCILLSVDPVIAVTIFPPVVVIEQSGQVTITCTPSIHDLPVHWLIGDEELQDGRPFPLTPPGLHHTLELLLDTLSLDLSGKLISCFVQDPELNITLASDVVPVYTVPGNILHTYCVQTSNSVCKITAREFLICESCYHTFCKYPCDP